MAWVLVPKGCPVSGSQVIVPCGNYGTFHFAVNSPTPNCAVVSQGVDASPKRYVAAFRAPTFPVNPNDDAPPPPQCTVGRVAVVDFFSSDILHGRSVRAVAGNVASGVPGQPAYSQRIALDDAAWTGLGTSVSDRHVLASLCTLVEQAESTSCAPSPVVNMSFGRRVEAGDPSSGFCQPTSIPCQVARVIDRLLSHSIYSVAAAGNHGELLFPANLANVISVGGVNYNNLVATDVSLPAIDTPSGSDGLMPDAAMCPRNWPAPAGSSYAAALLSGWFSHILSYHPTYNPTLHSSFHADWSTRGPCWTLMQEDAFRSRCNPVIDRMFPSLTGPSGEACWSGSLTNEQLTLGSPTITSPPADPSYDYWVATALNPTPAGDPCVPCTGDRPGGGLRINFSQSGGFPAGSVLQEVQLRVGTTDYAVPTTSQTRSQIVAGTLGYLTIVGGSQYVPPGSQPALRFRVTAPDNSTYWTSVPVVMVQ